MTKHKLHNMRLRQDFGKPIQMGIVKFVDGIATGLNFFLLLKSSLNQHWKNIWCQKSLFYPELSYLVMAQRAPVRATQ